MVDPVWLVKAFGIAVLIAVICGYLTLCALFYQGQWQIVLHPTRTSAPPETIAGVAFQSVRFGTEKTGLPQITGWWIPSDPGAAFAHVTMLYLPGGDGSLANDQATLASLHRVGVSILAVDYRGYGGSANFHPGEQSMTDDARSAWAYLTESRGLPGEGIVPYGKGVGASLALTLARSEPAVRAVVLDNPDFDVEQRVRSDARSRMVPVRLLLRERFALLPALGESTVPKLILSRGDHEDPAIRSAADPKITVALPPSSVDRYTEAVQRFLAQYLPAGQPSPRVATPAPSPKTGR